MQRSRLDLWVFLRLSLFRLHEGNCAVQDCTGPLHTSGQLKSIVKLFACLLLCKLALGKSLWQEFWSIWNGVAT